MRRKIILLALTCSLTILNSFALTPSAVIDFTGKEVSPAILVALSEIFRTELMETGIYDVMERNNMDEILTEQGFQYSGACTDLGCIVELGQLLEVYKVFSGVIERQDDLYIINVKMVDVTTGKIEQSFNEEFIGVTEDLDRLIEAIIFKITKGEKSFDFTEETACASFYINSEPLGANVYIDNEFIGVTPLDNPIKQIRKYYVKIWYQGYQPWKEEVTPNLSEINLLNAKLVPGANLEDYRKYRKSYLYGLMWSVLPGGGNVYAENYKMGIEIGLLRIFSTYGYFMMKDDFDSEEREVLKKYVVMINFLDAVTTPYYVWKYNKNLKMKYNVSLNPAFDKNDNLQIALTVAF